MDKDTTADIRGFLRPVLADLQSNLHAAGMPKPTKNQVASGMVHAASRLPIKVVKAMMEDYFTAEAQAYEGEDSPEQES